MIAWLAFALVWLRGGRVERVGAGVLLCDYVLTAAFAGTSSAFAVMAASAGVMTLVFMALAFRCDRWWPFLTASALSLWIMVTLLESIAADLSDYAAASARLGLWILIYLSLIAGVVEHWLAGGSPGRGTAISRSRVRAP